MILIPLMDTLYKNEWVDYTRLKSLSPQDRIESLYNQTPHSLSRVCLQCIEMWFETKSGEQEIIADMVCAIDHFWKKAQIWDKKAIDTLWRFSNHITWSGRLRFTYIIKLAMNKTLFDNELSSAYEKAISLLHKRPQYIRFLKDVTDDTAKEIVTAIDNNTVIDDDKY